LASGEVLIAGGYRSPDSLGTCEIYKPETGEFRNTTGALKSARNAHAAVLLSSGQVLIVGGNLSGAAIATAELYDPATERFTYTNGNLATGRWYHAATLLPSGKVLVAGGARPSHTVLSSLELFDPATGLFADAGSMANVRMLPAVALLPSGKVLIAGGCTSDFSGCPAVASADVYDPVQNAVTADVPLSAPRGRASATLLPSGRVLVTGGANGTTNLASAELFDPLAPKFTPTAGSLAVARSGPTATLLPSGRVLVAGGDNGTTVGSITAAEIFDFRTGTFQATTAPMNEGRYAQTATLLVNGRVLLDRGGYMSSPGNGAVRTTSEVFDPGTGRFRLTATSPLTARASHAAALLADGRVLVVGGDPYTASAELYDSVADSYAPTGGMGTVRSKFGLWVLPNGKALAVAGGSSNESGGGPLSTAEVWTPGTGFVSAGSLQLPRSYMTTGSALLPGGFIVLVGGYSYSFTSTAELFNTATGQSALSSSAIGGLGGRHGEGHTTVVLTSGMALCVGGFEGVYSGVSGTTLIDPARNAIERGPSLGTGRAYAALAWLPSHNILVVGGGNHDVAGQQIASAELYDEGRGASVVWTPTLTGSLPKSRPGATLTLVGTKFTGVSEASGGGTSSSATNFPLVQLRRQDNSALNFAAVKDWTATSATVTLPSSLIAGWHWLYVIVNGVPSEAKPILITLPIGSSCFGDDECASGFCVSGVCCGSSCADDRVACHEAPTCDRQTGICIRGAVDDALACTDQNACTANDHCSEGVCLTDQPKTCADPAACHDRATCVPATGNCGEEPVNDALACSGGACRLGTCTDLCESVTCPVPDECRTQGACAPATGQCAPNPAKADDVPCSIGSCQAGTCTDLCASVTCPAPDECHTQGACTSATGVCDDNPAKADNVPCSIGSCQVGTCTNLCAGVTCPASDECRETRVCDPQTGLCSNPAKADTATCTNGACRSGECVNLCAGKTCAALDDCHLVGTCDPHTGECSNPPVAADTTCVSDSNPCTRDVCDGAGACTHPAGNAGTPCRDSTGECDPQETCDGATDQCPDDAKKAADEACSDDGAACTRDVCDGQGACTHPLQPATFVCRESTDECDLEESCDGATDECPADAKKDEGTACADDGELCTGDVCSAGGVCTHPLQASTHVCREAGDECDVPESCDGVSAACPADLRADRSKTCSLGACEAGVCTDLCTGKTCTASDACRVAGTCDPQTGECSNPPAASDTACASDSNPCTRDVCDGAGGCSHPAGNAGATCRDSTGECDPQETCDGTSTQCPIDAKKAENEACTDDGAACTRDVCDGTGQCAHPLRPATFVCRESTDECDPEEKCDGATDECPADAKKDEGVSCADDGELCTSDVCNGGGVCTHPLQASTHVCREAGDECDVPESCDGVATGCPADLRADRTKNCSLGACEAGVCTDLCTGKCRAPRSLRIASRSALREGREGMT